MHSLCNKVGDFVPFRFSVPFGGIQMTQVNVVETVIKPLTCTTSDTEYVSEGIDKKTIGRCCPGPSKVRAMFKEQAALFYIKRLNQFFFFQ